MPTVPQQRSARFVEKVALITGGGAGIGLVYARVLAAEAAAVVLVDIDENGVNAAAESIAASGGRALAVTADVAREDEVARAVATACEVYGGVDVLVNNAAKHLGAFARPCTQLDRRSWRDMLDLNLTGALMCAEHCSRSMRERGGGVIINQSSAGAFKAYTGAYGVSKAALNALTAALAVELASDRIRVNGIAPSLVDSEAALGEISPERLERYVSSQLVPRLGRMTDLASVLLFLCSDEAAFMTGQTLLVDGGGMLAAPR